MRTLLKNLFSPIYSISICLWLQCIVILFFPRPLLLSAFTSISLNYDPARLWGLNLNTNWIFLNRNV